MGTKHYVMPDGVAFKTIEDLMEYYDIDLSNLEFKDDNVAVVIEAAKHVVDMWGVTEEDLIDGDFTDEERLMIKVAFGSEMNLDERNSWDTYISMMDDRLSITEDRYAITKEDLEKRSRTVGIITICFTIIFSALLLLMAYLKYNEGSNIVCEGPVVNTELDLRQGMRVTGTLLSSEDDFIYNNAGYPIFYYTGTEYWMWGHTRLVDVPEEYIKNHILSKELFDQHFYFNDKWELVVDSESLTPEEGTCYGRQAEFGVNDFYIIYPVRLSTTDELYGFVIYPED